MGRFSVVAGVLFMLLTGLVQVVLAESSAVQEEAVYLEPEEAFRVAVKTRSQERVEVRFTIADGYHLYKDKVKFAAGSNSVVIPSFPAATRKESAGHDAVEIYRGTVTIPLTLQGSAFPKELTVSTQGCADSGLCYPPLSRTIHLSPPPLPSEPVASAPVAQAHAAAKPISLETVASQASAPTATPDTGEHALSGGDQDRVAGLLHGSNLPLILVSFFGFGLLMAFTPCIFPMIPILSGIIVGHGDRITKGRALVLSSAYVGGMAITYTLAGIAAGLSGTMLSAALQNVWVLGAFALVFVVLSLSMFGFYEVQLPITWQQKFSSRANSSGGSLIGVVIMGALSALIVGPCVAAPLAGALLYIAKTGNVVLGGTALFCMALGMGAPLILVGVAARSALPKAGAWMEGVKKAFGVILLGVALWLIQPVTSPAVIMGGLSALLIISAMYLHVLDPLPPEAGGWLRFWKGTGVMLAVYGTALLIGLLGGSRNPLQPLSFTRDATASSTARTSPLPFTTVATLAELNSAVSASDKPVMLLFTADWCTACKELKHNTFPDVQLRNQMAAMTRLVVDVTDNSEDDKRLMRQFGIYGPPGIILLKAETGLVEQGRIIGYQTPAELLAKIGTVP